ncbi:MAG: 2-isopropylmalate synthase [Planctomycetes bacterium]|nr:2-isopropylmalate synthase [Planctomycetota bacterium]
MKDDTLLIFDTTLRDGEQSPGASLNTPEKLEIARQLALLQVDVIEAGFPIASPGDFEAVQIIAREVEGPVVAGLARALPLDIDRAAKAVEPARRKRIHVFLATSEIHLKFKLKKAQKEIVKQAIEAVRYARQFCEDIEFSPEDASRTEPRFLVEVVQAAIDAGATTINIPDTVGYALPDAYGALIAQLKAEVPNIEKAVLSVHCHNDLGLAVANSLAGIRAGARQAECTINGIGERAGNAALEEIVMALRTRRDVYGIGSRIDTRRILATSRMVSKLTGLFVQRNKAIVGENAFAHEAGIHQDGILKERTTYEIMRPEDVGFSRTNLVLGKHSGRHAFRERIRDLGFDLPEDKLTAAFDAFKILADKKKEIFDEDLAALVEEQVSAESDIFRLVRFHTTSGIDVTPTATVRLRKESEEPREDAAVGDGPVDAVYRTIDRITGIPCRLLDYQIRAITKGKDAMGEVSLQVEHNALVVHGRASSTDILEASARAYLNAVNKIARRQRSAPPGAPPAARGV